LRDRDVAVPVYVEEPTTALGQVSAVSANSDIVEQLQRINGYTGVSSSR